MIAFLAYHFGFQASEILSFDDEDLEYWLERSEFTTNLERKGMMRRHGR